MSDSRAGSHQPVIAGLIGGAVAVSAGIGVMLAEGGEPAQFYALVNAAALPVGLLLAALMLLVPARAHGLLALAAALALLATALSGIELEGVRRWMSVGGFIQIQPSLILLPLLLCGYARHHADIWHGGAVIIAALAIGLMPDLSMAMALLMVTFAVWLADRTRVAALVLAVGVFALIVCVRRDDPLTGARFVEDVLVDGWRTSVLHGVILTLGALAMLAPILTARRVVPLQQRAVVAFALAWGMLLIASIFAPFPTPLLGYGASAILGYFLSIMALCRPKADPSSKPYLPPS